MAYRHRELGFFEETALRVRVAPRELGMQELERVFCPVGGLREVDLAHCAGPERAHYRAVAESVANFKHQLPVAYRFLFLVVRLVVLLLLFHLMQQGALSDVGI